MRGVFEALADSNRRRVLDLLRHGELPAGALGAGANLSQPGISKHLRVLRDAGLVRARADGRQRLYALEPAKLAEIGAWLEPYRAFWTARLDALDRRLSEEGGS